MAFYENRKTGEIIEVIAYSGTIDRDKSDYVAFIDADGNERKEWGNIHWDYREVDPEAESERDYRSTERIFMAILGSLLDKAKINWKDRSENRFNEYLALCGAAFEMAKAAKECISTLHRLDMEWNDDEEDDDYED